MPWWDDYFNQQPQRPPYYETQRDAQPLTPAQPSTQGDWTDDLRELLKEYMGKGSQQDAGPVGATVSGTMGAPSAPPTMAYLPPTGKGGFVDVVKIIMAIAGGAAGAGGMGGSGAAAGAPGAAAGAGGAGMTGAGAGAMGGSGAAAGASGAAAGAGGAGMTGAGMSSGSIMDMFSNLMGGGGSGGSKKETTPSAQALQGQSSPGFAFAPMTLPMETIPTTSSPGPIFGRNLVPSTLDIWYPRQRNSLFPGNSYG